MDIQAINDFKHTVNKDTIYPLWQAGLNESEICELLAAKTWEQWNKRKFNKDSKGVMLKTNDGFAFVELTEELREQLPWRISNFLNIIAEFVLVEHLAALGIPCYLGSVEMDYKGIDVVIEGEYAAINIAVHKDSKDAWAAYVRKYGNNEKCHYHFTFDSYKNISQNDVKNWLIKNRIYDEFFY